jgi:hypothetical protein
VPNIQQYINYNIMKLNLAFVLSVFAVPCLAINVDASTSYSSDTIPDNETSTRYSRLLQTVGREAMTLAPSNEHTSDEMMMAIHSGNEEMIRTEASSPTFSANQVESWIQMGPDFIGDENDQLCWSNALAKGGTRYAIGLPAEPSDIPGNNGKIQVFDNMNPLSSSTSYDQQVGSDITVDKGSLKTGYSVAMSKDGTRLIAGGEDFVAMFEYSEDQKDWIPLGTNSIIDLPTSGRWGKVTMTEDGMRVAVSNPWKDGSVGEVIVFDFVCDGVSCSWIEAVVLSGVLAKELFGGSLSMSNDGRLIVIGSIYFFDPDRPGLVRVFEEQTDGGWQQIGGDLLGEVGTGVQNVSIAGNGKKFAVHRALGNSVLVYDITDSRELELDNTLPCNSGYSTIQAIMSDDGDRVVAACGKEAKIFDRNASTSTWENSGSISGLAWRVVSLSLSGNGRVAAVGFPFYEQADQRGVSSVWRNPSRPPRCVDSPLQFQVESVGGSSLPFFCKWAKENRKNLDCSDTGKVATHCPQACSKCWDLKCSDAKGSFFKPSGKETTCVSVRKAKNTRKLCKKSHIAKTCRATCNYCGCE